MGPRSDSAARDAPRISASPNWRARFGSSASTPAEYAPLLAPLVDIPLPRGPRAKLAPEELRRRQLAALVAWILAGARSQPSRSPSRICTGPTRRRSTSCRALAERGAQAPLLIVATARPEFRPPWSLRSHHSVISLAPLDRAQVARMVGELASRQALSEDVVEGVSDRTGGVPLFVEEVTRLLLERGEAGRRAGDPADPAAVARGAARPTRRGARGRADRRGSGARFFLCAAARCRAGSTTQPCRVRARRLADADLLFVEGAPP